MNLVQDMGGEREEKQIYRICETDREICGLFCDYERMSGGGSIYKIIVFVFVLLF